MTLQVGTEPRTFAKPPSDLFAHEVGHVQMLGNGWADSADGMDAKQAMLRLNQLIFGIEPPVDAVAPANGSVNSISGGPRHANPGTPLEFNPRKPWEALKLRRSDDVQEQIRTTLKSGRIAHSPTSDSVSGGVNGKLDTVTLVNRHTGARTKAVLKPISGGGAQELFGYEVARAMKVEHLVPAVGRRADGTAAMEFRPGRLFDQAGIRSSRSLEDAFQEAHSIRDAGAADAVIARRAHVDRQLVQTFDYLIANGDRHGHNALYDAKRGIVSLIDNGLLDRYDPKDGVPKVRMDFQGGAEAVRAADGVTTMQLDDEVVSILQRTDRTHLKRAFGQMLRDQSGAPSVGSYARATKPEFLEQMLGRLDDAIKHGAIRVRGSW
ncbi:MAG: hypothetical protein JWM90_248 [Thermoleophilia bacterium]|nr:hypothetical protein [Thermoleophilia bacterium]